MKSLSTVFLFGAANAALVSFESFVQQHQRSYQKESDEYELRRSVFESRLQSSNVHNMQPGKLWTAGVNKLWDWSPQELRSLRGWDGSAKPSNRGGIRRHAFLQQQNVDDDAEIPNEKLWTGLTTSDSADDCCSKCDLAADCGVAVFVEGVDYTSTCHMTIHCEPTSGCTGDTCSAVIPGGAPSPTPSPRADVSRGGGMVTMNLNQGVRGELEDMLPMQQSSFP